MDTICAIATPAGRGGIGIVRVSGPNSLYIIRKLTGVEPMKRVAHHSKFSDAHGKQIDEGITIFFAQPNSFTGEDIAEFQCHGSPVILDRLVSRILPLGARLALPGEFTERAYLNNKIDLAQAEGVADLINSASQEAADAALRSLTGEFSRTIKDIDEKVLNLRVYLEGAIDFADEEIDFLADGESERYADEIFNFLDGVLDRSNRGAVLNDGIDVVISGPPNVGKSSLLNALGGINRAIVTDIPGTTRDLLEMDLILDGLPIRFTDTAGIRDSEDRVEREGMNRAMEAVGKADLVLWVMDNRRLEPSFHIEPPIFRIRNKCDLSGEPPRQIDESTFIVSAKLGSGLDVLVESIKSKAGFVSGENAFVGRRRHLEALKLAKTNTEAAIEEIKRGNGELAAESLRAVQDQLGNIVGNTSNDDLLGAIFSSFCIGK